MLMHALSASGCDISVLSDLFTWMASPFRTHAHSRKLSTYIIPHHFTLIRSLLFPCLGVDVSCCCCCCYCGGDGGTTEGVRGVALARHAAGGRLVPERHGGAGAGDSFRQGESSQHGTWKPISTSALTWALTKLVFRELKPRAAGVVRSRSCSSEVVNRLSVMRCFCETVRTWIGTDVM